ncbi:polyhydroxyalkanoate depolymerase [Geodermatophilus obscurus]|uniref:Polyhydroxyalkanoate depolymerase, intracellular n=1 Tax=Geodermatophilus obscurus (strain ATCC 25078 / DSM 43160 / JCM 3152 / CCUG 61914 / KCC A-0152 / KCTC 9177 / NBRC 13315 / NRRL B-3577 / G-20) TaxID=526225 RepID=D2SCJ5_GEOOG|nr:polyhydroxyalkanoate depolymerase [Geodermatophilus obscurus]ADB76323.1 polyhydroxyalkanoate depolymerase, intracellular [Geodermatophilus obscurus DSM 43160]
MLYTAYEINRRATAPVLTASELTARALQALPAPWARTPAVRHVRALCDIVAKARPTHDRPAFGIPTVQVDGRDADVFERPALTTPFGTLLHFAKPSVTGQPRVLVVGPMSGHFTTLIRPTIKTLLADHDVYVIDWHNARDIPAAHGPFGLDEYIEHVMQALRHLGPDTHVVAVCQPAVPVLAAVALLAAQDDPAQPASVTLMAGPIDTRVNPNRVNKSAADKPISWFERRVVDTVPSRYPGAGRRVYPGVVQLTAFMSMNPRRHLSAHARLYRDLVTGNAAAAATTRAFYDEYGAVMDVPAEFYLETVARVFQQHELPLGRFTWRGQHVDPGAIRNTALLTVEGANDDICSPGQTEAAHRLCTGIPEERRGHHLQNGVGHYGVFSGSRWEAEIYPVVRSFVESARTAERVASGS